MRNKQATGASRCDRKALRALGSSISAWLKCQRADRGNFCFLMSQRTSRAASEVVSPRGGRVGAWRLAPSTIPHLHLLCNAGLRSEVCSCQSYQCPHHIETSFRTGSKKCAILAILRFSAGPPGRGNRLSWLASLRQHRRARKPF